MTVDGSELKRLAGHRAADEVRDGMLVGLGTGSTAEHAIRRLGERVRNDGLRISGLPTSTASEQLARAEGIPLVGFSQDVSVDLTIDGADEIDGSFDMIKGGGGALLREKVVAQHSQRVIIVVDPAKQVKRLGEAFPLPVEVVPLVWRTVAGALASLAAEPQLRQRGGEPFTDNGNYILDAKFDGIDDAEALDLALNQIAGVVENGLFVALATDLVVGHPEGAELIQKPASD